MLTHRGVLRSHAKNTDDLYICKVCIDLGREARPKKIFAFGDCLDSHRLGPDGVSTVKDAYGREDVVKK